MTPSAASSQIHEATSSLRPVTLGWSLSLSATQLAAEISLNDACALRDDRQQQAHQLGLPVRVGLVEDVMEVSLDGGHR